MLIHRKIFLASPLPLFSLPFAGPIMLSECVLIKMSADWSVFGLIKLRNYCCRGPEFYNIK